MERTDVSARVVAPSRGAFRKDGFTDVARSKTPKVARRRRETGTCYRSRSCPPFQVDKLPSSKNHPTGALHRLVAQKARRCKNWPSGWVPIPNCPPEGAQSKLHKVATDTVGQICHQEILQAKLPKSATRGHSQARLFKLATRYSRQCYPN